jgi:hypothetical protein
MWRSPLGPALALGQLSKPMGAILKLMLVPSLVQAA